MTSSSRSRKRIPHQNPMKAGMNAHCPLSELCSMAGTIRLHMDAATMTPAANPVRARWTPVLMSFLRKNTHAAPAAVPKNGIIRPQKTVLIA